MGRAMVVRLLGALAVCASVAGGCWAAGEASPRGACWPFDLWGAELLPGEDLFTPLVADPRQAGFSAFWQYEMREDFNRGAVSLGDSIGLLRWGDVGCAGAQVQIDVEAAVFAVFDMDTTSKDLINADYSAALPIVYRNGGFSTRLRWHHQSSHLGDEYVLHHRITRINLTYEEWDILGSYEWTHWRVYGGCAYKYHVEPTTYDRWGAQWGVEWRGESICNGFCRPVAAVHVRMMQQNDWDLDPRVAGGIEIANPDRGWRVVRFLGEYYDGHSPDGQFYDERVRWFGAGIQMEF